jgi:hypothetical protein
MNLEETFEKVPPADVLWRNGPSRLTATFDASSNDRMIEFVKGSASKTVAITKSCLTGSGVRSLVTRDVAALLSLAASLLLPATWSIDERERK